MDGDASVVYEVSTEAYATIVLHAAKHPTELLGVLVGGGDGGGTWGRGALPAGAVRVDEAALALVDQLLGGAARGRPDVADFEDHCLDPRADWLNAALPAQLARVG